MKPPRDPWGKKQDIIVFLIISALGVLVILLMWASPGWAMSLTENDFQYTEIVCSDPLDASSCDFAVM